MCPPLPKFKNSLNENTYHPPLPALTSHNLKKFNSASIDEYPKNSTSSTLPYANDNKLSMMESLDLSSSNLNETSAELNTLRTTYNYPLISGSIPSHIGSHAYLNVKPSTAFKRDQGNNHVDQAFPVNSILSGPKQTNSGEKNKVKFSDEVTVAIVPEISRKEKLSTFNDKTKRKPDFLVDLVKRELKASLPLCHPDEYLKDFLPAVAEKSSKSNDDKKEKSSIKVVNFGIL